MTPEIKAMPDDENMEGTMPKILVTGSQDEKQAFIRRIMKALIAADVSYSMTYGSGDRPDVIEPYPGPAFDKFISEKVS